MGYVTSDERRLADALEAWRARESASCDADRLRGVDGQLS